MTEYLDLTANLIHPRTLIDKTALVISQALENSDKLYGYELRDIVYDKLGSLSAFYSAIKALRNMGVPMPCTHGRFAVYTTRPTVARQLNYSQEISHYTYSRHVTNHRQIKGHLSLDPQNEQLKGVGEDELLICLSIGRHLGKNLQVVFDEAQPLTHSL